MTGESGAENSHFLYVQDLSRGGLTIPSTNLVNYGCAAFTMLESADNLITKSGLPVRKAAEHVLIHCLQSFETFSCTTYEKIAQKIINSTAANICFNNKRKICTDSVAADGVKTFTERQREKSLIKIYCFYFYFRLMLQFVIFSKTKYLTRSLIYVHKFGVSQGTNG